MVNNTGMVPLHFGCPSSLPKLPPLSTYVLRFASELLLSGMAVY